MIYHKHTNFVDVVVDKRKLYINQNNLIHGADKFIEYLQFVFCLRIFNEQFIITIIMYQSKLQKKKNFQNKKKSQKIIKFQENTVIFQKGSQQFHKYRVLVGQACFVSQKGEILYKFTVGKIINQTEANLKVPLMKCVIALTQVYLQRLQTEYTIKRFLNIIHQTQKKQPVDYLRSLSPIKWHQVRMYIQLFETCNFNSLSSEYLYFIQQGKVILFNDSKIINRNMALMSINQGGLFTKFNGAKYEFQQKNVLLSIKMQIIKQILAEEYHLLEDILNEKQNIIEKSIISQIVLNRKELIQRKSDKTGLVRRQLLRNKSIRSAVSQYELIEDKVKFRNRLQSCFQQQKYFQSIKEHFYSELCMLNKKIYGRNYLLQKRMEINKYINQNFKEKNQSQYQQITLYDPNSMHLNYSHLKKFIKTKKTNQLNFQIPLVRIKKIRKNLENSTSLVRERFNNNKCLI